MNGEWQTFPNQRAAEQAAYQEYRDNLRRNAENFRITDRPSGEGGPKAKYQANVAAIKLLKYLEETPGRPRREQQEVLSRYVGWGGVADAFGPGQTRVGCRVFGTERTADPREIRCGAGLHPQRPLYQPHRHPRHL